jgi:hypothetical protein
MRWAWLVGVLMLGCGGEADETAVAPLAPRDDAGRATLASCAGEFRCDGARLEVCRADGTAFEPVEVCPSAEACDPAEGVCR